jgi:DNA polymerase III epsilon subunit-like protein
MVYWRAKGQMDFVAIDVETANADLASICQIGIAHFSNGVLASEWKSYIDPQDHFDEMNVSVHGIDASIVAGAPTFDGLVCTIKESLNGHVVVTHTAFDKVALYRAGTKCKAEPFHMRLVRLCLCCKADMAAVFTEWLRTAERLQLYRLQVQGS